MILTFDFLTSK